MANALHQLMVQLSRLADGVGDLRVEALMRSACAALARGDRKTADHALRQAHQLACDGLPPGPRRLIPRAGRKMGACPTTRS